jgi:hypothetical protein
VLQEGDLVAVLQGGKVPYVLQSSRGHFKFVHTSFVDGIMMGEVGNDLESVLNIR